MTKTPSLIACLMNTDVPINLWIPLMPMTIRKVPDLIPLNRTSILMQYIARRRSSTAQFILDSLEKYEVNDNIDWSDNDSGRLIYSDSE